MKVNNFNNGEFIILYYVIFNIDLDISTLRISIVFCILHNNSLERSSLILNIRKL